MPVYDYVCKKCQKSFELVLTLSEYEKGDIRCPKCG
ncbi:MAG: zinc ribbon domain-containing protein, partial [Acidobacteriota bacterium]|nr:zinc ribbon domain-containing protein [Acidobacteriota bacterium]